MFEQRPLLRLTSFETSLQLSWREECTKKNICAAGCNGKFSFVSLVPESPNGSVSEKINLETFNTKLE